MKLDELKEKIQNGNYTIQDFTACYKELAQNLIEFQKILEDVYENDKDNLEIRNLLSQVSTKNSSVLVDRMKRLGFALRKNKIVKESLINSGYRLMEQTRAGKRDDVYYGLLRIFISAKESFPLDLIEAFKPHYSDEMFKVLIFSFLSGVISQEEKTINQEN